MTKLVIMPLLPFANNTSRTAFDSVVRARAVDKSYTVRCLITTVVDCVRLRHNTIVCTHSAIHVNIIKQIQSVPSFDAECYHER
jgi:hypothetical protein